VRAVPTTKAMPPSLALQRTMHHRGAVPAIIAHLGGAGQLSFIVRRFLMSDLLHCLIEAVLHGLTWLVDAISPSRLEEMPTGWAWLATACLAVGFVTLIAAACTGFTWLFYSFVGVLIASLGILCLGTFWPRTARRG
jgi:hypothetical protein